MSQIGDRVRTLREARGESQESVSRRAEMSLSTYVRIELGYNQPTIPTLVKIAGALEVQPSELLDEPVAS